MGVVLVWVWIQVQMWVWVCRGYGMSIGIGISIGVGEYRYGYLRLDLIQQRCNYRGKGCSVSGTGHMDTTMREFPRKRQGKEKGRSRSFFGKYCIVLSRKYLCRLLWASGAMGSGGWHVISWALQKIQFSFSWCPARGLSLFASQCCFLVFYHLLDESWISLWKSGIP